MADDIRFAPINDGREEDCQCARCGSSAMSEDCEACGGEGLVDAYGTPDWQDYEGPDDDVCDVCLGRGGWWRCISPSDWCEVHPIPGRENVERGKVEWYDLPPRTPDKALLGLSGQSLEDQK